MPTSASERVLIFKWKGRNARLAAKILEEASITSKICRDMSNLLAEIELGAGVAVLSEEVISDADVKALASWVVSQPPWSDFPFILVTPRGAGLESSPAAFRHMEILGNVSFLERPFRPVTLVSVVRSALRGRRRQYEAGARLHSLEESEYKFRSLAESIPALCWMAHPDGHVFWFNRRWYEYTGALPVQMEGWGWQSVHDPQFLPSVIERWKASLASGVPFEMVFPLKGTDGILRPFLTRAVPIMGASGKIVRWFGTSTDITDQKQAEEHLRFLMHEITHRSKNLLAIIQSMTRQLAQSSEDISDFSRQLSDRIQGLAQTHDQLLEQNWKGASLRQLIERQMEMFGADNRDVVLNGPEIQIKPKAAEALGLAFHELATNAAKHGAFTHPHGVVRIHWEIEADGTDTSLFRLKWQEAGGPKVNAPDRKGFGNTVLTRVVSATLSGKAALDYRSEGLCWSIECPANEAVIN